MVGDTFIMSLSKISALYNVVFSLIVFFLLLKLVLIKKKSKKVFIKPWYLIFAAISVFVLEEFITILKFFHILSDAIVPRWINAVFELIMLVLFIYMLFLQINHVTEKYNKKKAF